MAIEIPGKYGTAIVYSGTLDSGSLRQLQMFMNHPAAEDAHVRVMPDVHAGKGSVIGFTAKLDPKHLIPNIVGVDIGCGVSTVQIKSTHIDFAKLDEVICSSVPAGFKVHSTQQSVPSELKSKLAEVALMTGLPVVDQALAAIGTLGGGNHFIEMEQDDEGRYYLTVHSGSRKFGHTIAQYFQSLASVPKLDLSKIPPRQREAAKLAFKPIPKELAFLSDEDEFRYMFCHDVAVHYARTNRTRILQTITAAMGFEWTDHIDSVHNYIGPDHMIRKGAIMAVKGPLVVIPMNMAAGIIIGRGKGNEEWNNSAPHGLGRHLSRSKAKEQLDIEEYKQVMDNVWSSCVSRETLDEAPMAYKDPEEVLGYLHETVEIETIARSVYNFKA